MYTYMGTCDNTTDFPVDQSTTFLALGLLHNKSKMAGVQVKGDQNSFTYAKGGYQKKNGDRHHKQTAPLPVKNDSSLR